MASALKTAIFGIISVAIAIVGTLVTAELLLRFLPYSEGLRAQEVSARQPVFRFASNRTSTYSDGWNFNLVNRVRVNNDGFVNDRDYDAAAKSPLLAIVGDSYIEAVMVPYRETVQGRLASALEGRGRVYSFAASGAGLSQYLIWARHARDTYRPSLFLFNIIPNDFAESLHKLEHSPGFWRFEARSDGGADWRLTEYRPSLLRRVMRNSALVMYLTQNVRAHTALRLNFQNLGADDRRWVGNIEATTPEDRLADFRWAVDRFLEHLPAYSGVPAERIMLSFDGFRPQIYGGPEELHFATRSTWATMRSEMMNKATALGMTVIDLDPLQRERFARDRQRFEFPTDSHWNGRGHEILADAMRASTPFRAVFAPAEGQVQ